MEDGEARKEVLHSSYKIPSLIVEGACKSSLFQLYTIEVKEDEANQIS